MNASDDMIKSYYSRWTSLEEEKATISEDLRQLFAEAKSNGFDTKALRAAFRDKANDGPEKSEFDAICDLHRNALDAPHAQSAHAHEKTLNNSEQYLSA